MSARTGTTTAAGIALSVFLTGVSPATGQTSEPGGGPIEVIVRDDVEVGEAPSFEVVRTDFSGLVELFVESDDDQTIEVHSGATLAWEPTDPHAGSQWANSTNGLIDAWDLSLGSPEVVIAVLDTGVGSDANLGNRLLPGASFVDGDPHIDHSGHGTWVASIAAASHDSVGIAGVCPGCSILPVQVADESGFVPWAAAANGITYAVDAGADIINLSFGAPHPSQIVADAIAYASANGVTVVGAAGNNGTADPFYPAATDGVIGVAAHDDRLQRYQWSSHGSWADVSGPGCSTGLVNGNYSSICGTSFAAPWVAGVLGLAFSANGTMTPADAEAFVESGTHAADYVETGWVHAATALSLVGGPAPSPSSTGFTDVPSGAYFTEAIGWLVEREVTTGTSPTTFSPEAPVTRGQLATFLWRLNGTPATTTAPAFTDVPTGAFYATAVAWLVDNEITTGTSPTTFSPDTAITRGQLATFLWRMDQATS